MRVGGPEVFRGCEQRARVLLQRGHEPRVRALPGLEREHEHGRPVHGHGVQRGVQGHLAQGNPLDHLRHLAAVLGSCLAALRSFLRGLAVQFFFY